MYTFFLYKNVFHYLYFVLFEIIWTQNSRPKEINGKAHYKVTILKSKFSLIRVSLIGLWAIRPRSSTLSLTQEMQEFLFELRFSVSVGLLFWVWTISYTRKVYTIRTTQPWLQQNKADHSPRSNRKPALGQRSTSKNQWTGCKFEPTISRDWWILY